MKKSELKKLIKEEYKKVLLEKRYEADESVGGDNPELEDSKIKRKSKFYTYPVLPGDTVHFKIDGIKYTKAQILGFDKSERSMFVLLPNGKYTIIDAYINGADIKKIECDDYNIVMR